METCYIHGIKFEKKETCVINGMTIYSKCPKCEEETKNRIEFDKMQEERKAQEALLNSKRNRLSNAGISKRYLIEGFKDTDFSIKHGKYLEIEKGEFKYPDNLVLMGNCGIGKSFFCYRLVELALENNLNYRILKARELRDIYKGGKDDKTFSFNKIEHISKAVFNLDGIVIDEIDDIFGDSECFKHLVSICYDSMIRVIVIGNCMPEELKNKIEAKTYSRIAGGRVLSGVFKDLRICEKNIKK